MLKYKIENNEVTITGYKDQFVKSIVIPDMIDGYSVTRIARCAFSGRNNLKHLVIPNSVNDIGYRLGCKNLKFINEGSKNNSKNSRMGSRICSGYCIAFCLGYSDPTGEKQNHRSSSDGGE